MDRGLAQAKAVQQQMSTMDLLGCDVTLFLSFDNLERKDVLSKSDPFAVLEAWDVRSKAWRPLGQTEYVKNTETGSWAKSFDMRFIFEETQQLVCRVFDYDSMSNHDFLGQVAFTLGNVMGARGQTLKVFLDEPGKPSKNRGSLTIRAEKKAGSVRGAKLFLHLRGHKFDSKDWFGMRPSDPYYVIHREVNGSMVMVHKSEFIKDNNNPTWKMVELPLDKLCRGNLDEELVIQVFDYDDGTKDDLIGDAKVTVNKLLQAAQQNSRIPVIHPPTKKKYTKSSYQNSGTLEVLTARVERSSTEVMLDYIAGGLQLNLIVAVDFTASNGNPSDPRSLHFRSPGMYNQYQSAIAAVGSILESYDSDGHVPVFGFGGSIQGTVSHCFPLNGNPNNPEVQGIGGVLQAYENALTYTALSGPTFFANLLSQVNQMAYAPEMSQVAQKYTILLILTDGEVMDMDATIDQLVRGSTLPLSVIIVGVGSADFGKMEHLDADDFVLQSSSGAKAERDIVQFVPFNRFQNNADMLAREVLHEVPDQIVQYFRKHRINPNPPLQVSQNLQPINSLAAPAPTAPPGGQIPSASVATASAVNLSGGYPMAQPASAPAAAPYPQGTANKGHHF